MSFMGGGVTGVLFPCVWRVRAASLDATSPTAAGLAGILASPMLWPYKKKTAPRHE